MRKKQEKKCSITAHGAKKHKKKTYHDVKWYVFFDRDYSPIY